MNQKWESYSTEVPGKWVLSGEHTVLRGGMAIALPHPELKLKLEFRPDESTELPAPILELFLIAKHWLSLRGVVRETPQGSLKIESTIPVSAGLGSSAALSVAVARWILSACGLGPELERGPALERELAREMENHFHGKSSGMDVAVVSIGEPILFSMKDGAIRLGLSHLPHFVFRDTGLRSSTKDCIEAVEKIRALDPAHGERLDKEMKLATTQILEGLRLYDEGKIEAGAAMIAVGMNRSSKVFQEWGLIPNGLSPLIADLQRTGWKACRLTGSGRGGFLVGLK